MRVITHENYSMKWNIELTEEPIPKKKLTRLILEYDANLDSIIFMKLSKCHTIAVRITFYLYG